MRPEAGLNLCVRQPIPTFFSLPWRMEASADLRNLLAQGYFPRAASAYCWCRPRAAPAAA